MVNCNPAYTPGVRQEPSLDQLQAVACSVTYLAYVTRYDIVRGTYMTAAKDTFYDSPPHKKWMV